MSQPFRLPTSELRASRAGRPDALQAGIRQHQDQEERTKSLEHLPTPSPRQETLQPLPVYRIPVVA
ncbi:hypothetical protein LY78DRAFT_678550 [Colletotrichum sublineola]|nr:hypothetical protein LY78DRAFT_678550 [Colletotrichum sublineola]